MKQDISILKIEQIFKETFKFIDKNFLIDYILIINKIKRDNFREKNEKQCLKRYIFVIKLDLKIVSKIMI